MPVPALLRAKRTAVPLAAVTVVALGVGAFVAYGAYTRSQPVDYARGGSDFGVVAPEPSPSGSGAAGLLPSVVATATPSPTASATTGAPRPVATPTTPAAAARVDVPRASAAPSRATTAAALVQPRVGRYGLRVRGKESVKFGALSFCDQTLPEQTELVVSRASGEAPGSYNVDLGYFPGQSGKHDERHIYRYTKDQVFLDYEIATVTCQGVRQSSDTSFDPAQLRVQLPLAVGASLMSKVGDADRTETSTSRVTKAVTLPVAGERVPTWVIETRTEFTGSESGTRTQTWWWAPSWGLPVQWSEQISGGRSGASYREDVTVTVTSRP